MPGRKNLQQSAAACRDSCARNPRCTTWLWCARPGGCDDGKVCTATIWQELTMGSSPALQSVAGVSALLCGLVSY